MCKEQRRNEEMRKSMYNRYADISKFITDPNLLQVDRDEVYISNENDYGIVVDLEACYTSFDELKHFIVFLSMHICELDNIVQRFNKKKRIKNNGYGYVRLPNPSRDGVLRFDYLQSMENDPAPQKRTFPYDLEVIYIGEPNFITFEYWHTAKNATLDAIFEYKENKFFLRTYGAFDCIPDNWEESE